MADGTPQPKFNIPYREVKGFTGLCVDILRFPCQVPDRARCQHCNCIPKRIYHLLCPRHGLCSDCKKYCDGYYCDECRIHTTSEQLGVLHSKLNLYGILLKVLCDVCGKQLLLGELEEHLREHTNQGRMKASKVQETTNKLEDVSEKSLRVSNAASERCHICNETVKNSDYVEHLNMHIEKRNNQGDSIVQETPNQDTAMEVEETGSDETRPHTDYKEHSLDGEHCEQCDKDPVICSRCCLFVERNNMQKHTYLSCPERTIYCERCHSSFPCSMEETHKSQCPKMARECSDCGVNVLNENLQNHLDTECQKRVVLCGACNSMMCYDERGDHDQECPENPVFCAYCEGEVLRKDKSKHASECPMRLVYCENCEGFYAYALKKDHDQQCLEKRVVCDDCKGEVLRKEKSRHASECPMRAVCCENCGGFYAYSSEKEHREQCEIKKPACEYCKLDLKGDVEKAIDTISELQQKIKDMERCNMSQQDEAKNKEAKLVKKIQELENRQMSKQEETRNENAKLVKRIQELENRQLEADQYHINLEDDVKVYRTVLQNLEDKVGRISKEAVTRRRVEMLNERVETYLGPMERLLNGLRDVDNE